MKAPLTGPQGHAPNLDTIVRAAMNDHLALLEVRDRSTGTIRTALVAVNREANGDYSFVPFALMIDGNPFELLDPPNFDRSTGAP